MEPSHVVCVLEVVYMLLQVQCSIFQATNLRCSSYYPTPNTTYQYTRIFLIFLLLQGVGGITTTSSGDQAFGMEPSHVCLRLGGCVYATVDAAHSALTITETPTQKSPHKCLHGSYTTQSSPHNSTPDTIAHQQCHPDKIATPHNSTTSTIAKQTQ